MDSTYFKRISDELCLFIHFEISRDRSSYTVWVYPSSPKLNPPELSRFPEQHGNPLGSKSFLNAKLGVGHGASTFSCGTKDLLKMTLSRHVLPAIERHAVTFLDQFKSLPDLVPFLEYPQWASALSA